MKQLLNLVLSMSFFVAHAQVIEHFSDGNFSTNPTWVGDDSLFQVNSAFQLQSKGTKGTSKDMYISTASNVIDSAEWQCWVRFNLSPSAQNFCRFYVVSDQQNLKGSLNGYFIQFGGVTGSTDSITLYKQKGTTFKRVIGGRPSTVSKSNNMVRIKLLRDQLGNWQLFSDTLGGTNFVNEGNGTDNEFTTSNDIGFYVKFTSSNVANYFLDDVYAGENLVDRIPPNIDSLVVLNRTIIKLNYSEKIDSTSALDILNYSVDNGIGLPTAVSFENSNDSSVLLHFQKPFQNGIYYSLSVSGVKDCNQNVIVPNSTKSFHIVLPDTARAFDVVIDEIFSKPSPSMGLPNYEFLELYNKSTRIISLKNWSIEDSYNKAKFPDIILFPDSFLVVTSTSGSTSLSYFGTTIGVTSFPSLNDDGDSIILKNEQGQVIHAITYSSDWYNDNLKKNGGWTLEMIDPKNPCSGKDNWNASKNNIGGTPGNRNSINGTNPDQDPPQLVKAYLMNTKTLKLTFNEQLDSTSIFAENVNVNPFGISSNIKLIPDYYSSFLAQFTDTFQTSKNYRVIVSGIKDCAQNSISENDVADFGLSENIDSGDIVINEILFNPRSDGVDFVELYNRSDKVIDLKNCLIANTNTDNTINDSYQIAPDGFILFPKSYCAISENSTVLKQQYFSSNTKNFIQCKMPSFPDNAGTALIIDISGKRYDQFSYDDKMHFPLLGNPSGVSLERIDFNRPTSDRTNWTSASSQVNATPAYKNSQYVSGNANGEHLKVEPEVFSPDGDGYKDMVNFSYSFDQSGYVGNLFIYDSRGMLVKQLLHNTNLGSSGTYSWNGISDKNEKAPIGIYVVYFEVFNLKGEVQYFQSSLVLGGKM